MKDYRKSIVLMSIMLFVVMGLICSASADQCIPKRLSWMLDEEKCGDLVFADVIEVMQTCDDVQMRARAAAGLGLYRGPEVFMALYRVLELDRSPMVRETALNALDSIMQRNKLRPGREIMEAYFLVFQFDRYAPNRIRARELLEQAGASQTLLKERSYVSARYQAKAPLQVYTSAKTKSSKKGTLQPTDYFAIINELNGNNQQTCWFNIETASGIKGWIHGLQDSREYFGTDDVPPRLFESTVRRLSDITNPAQTIALELRTSKPDDVFKSGDEIAFFVKADQDCFVTLIYFSPQSGGYILFPNRDQKKVGISAGTEVRIPAEASSLVIKASSPGVDEISVIATRIPVEIFPTQEVVQGSFCAIKTGDQSTARGIDRLLRYFKADSWAIAHKTITTVE